MGIYIANVWVYRYIHIADTLIHSMKTNMSMMMAMIVVIMMMMMVVVKGFFLPLPTQVILRNAWINFKPDILKPA